MPRYLLLLLLALIPAIAWSTVQSALDPKADHARSVADLGWVMFVGGALIFLLVLVLTLLALFGTPAVRAALGRHALIVAGGIVLPVLVLSALLLYSLFTASALVRAEGKPALRIAVAGELWWWRVRYLDERGEVAFETANEIRIPVGREIEFSLTSGNVIHSFWIPNLAGKIDMIPGHVNTLRLRTDTAGLFRGQCAEFCGAQHANMAFAVEALESEVFDKWYAAQQQPAAPPATARVQRGYRVFMENNCGACHMVRGSPARGTLGPDLTHVGSRLTLAAGTLTNRLGAFGGWIVGNQHLKPGNRMPSYDRMAPQDLRAIAAYLEGLQ